MIFKGTSHPNHFMISMIPHLPPPWQRLQRAATCPSVPGISLVSRVAFPHHCCFSCFSFS